MPPKDVIRKAIIYATMDGDYIPVATELLKMLNIEEIEGKEIIDINFQEVL